MGNLSCSCNSPRNSSKNLLGSIDSTNIRNNILRIKNKNKNNNNFRKKYIINLHYPVFRISTIPNSLDKVPQFKLIIYDSYSINDIFQNSIPIVSNISVNNVLNINNITMGKQIIDRFNSTCPVSLDAEQRNNCIYFGKYHATIEFTTKPLGDFKIVIEGYDTLRTLMFESKIDKIWANDYGKDYDDNDDNDDNDNDDNDRIINI